MIRIAIVVCCATLAAAEAEANPQFFNSFGHQQGHFNTYGYPTAMSSYSSYSAYPGYSAYQPRGFASVASYNPAYGYAAAGRYLADSVGAVHIAKREADAEPEAEAEADAFYMKGLYQTPYNTAYPTGYPTTSLRSYAAPVRSYPFRTVYSGYRNFIQPASQYYGRYYY